MCGDREVPTWVSTRTPIRATKNRTGATTIGSTEGIAGSSGRAVRALKTMYASSRTTGIPTRNTRRRRTFSLETAMSCAPWRIGETMASGTGMPFPRRLSSDDAASREMR